MQEIATINAGNLIEYQPITTNMMQDFINFIDAAPKTVETYTKAIRQFYRYLSFKGIDRPTREDVIAFREELKTDHAAATVQNYMVAVRLFFSWANSRGLYPNVAENLKGAKISRGYKRDYLTSKQVKKVLSTIDTSTTQGLRDYAICSLMITAGLRDIEVRNLDIADMRTLGDFTVVYLLGKGRDEKAEYVKVVEPVENAIREYIKAAGLTNEKSPMFVSLSNNSKGSRMTTRSISRICKNALVAAGFDSSRLTAHSFRHTAVTLSLLGGKSLQETQQFARHSNINTTQIYAHNLDRAKNDCEETIAKAIF